MLWPETMLCKCGGMMMVAKHEGQPIAEQVKRVYWCATCGRTHTWFFDVVTGKINSEREGEW